MNKKQINKKAEMTSQMVITIIILSIGVGLIFLIWAGWDWPEQIDREVCKESVILRGTLPNIAQGLIPLKCETKKLCVRGSKLLGKGECDEMLNEEKVVNANVNTLEEVERLIKEAEKPMIFVVNKSDLVSKDKIKKQIKQLRKKGFTLLRAKPYKAQKQPSSYYVNLHMATDPDGQSYYQFQDKDGNIMLIPSCNMEL